MYPLNAYTLYCGWLNFRGLLIFVVFVESLIHEFQCPKNGDVLFDLERKGLWSQILNPDL